MKIAVLIEDINRAGGTERAAVNLVNMLSASHEVHIISAGKSGQTFFPVEPSVNVEFLDFCSIPVAKVAKLSWFAKLTGKLKGRLREINPDIIVGEGHNINSLIPLVKSVNAKTIACEHIDFDTIPRSSKMLIRTLYPKLNAVVALSDIAAGKIAGINDNIVVIPNSLPFYSEQKADLSNEKIIMVGRLSKVKGYERIIPVAKKLMNDYPTWEINIFGDGDQKEYISSLLAENKITNVKINQPVKNIKDHYLNSSILLITSYNEAMPMVILEAQSCGLPVLGYHCEGTASLITDNVSGLTAHDEDEFYQKLRSLIDSQSLRTNIGDAGKAQSAEYSEQNVLRKWMDLFISL